MVTFSTDLETLTSGSAGATVGDLGGVAGSEGSGFSGSSLPGRSGSGRVPVASAMFARSEAMPGPAASACTVHSKVRVAVLAP